MGSGSDEVEEIRQEIDETRENLGSAVGALAYKADVKNRGKEALEDKKEVVMEKVDELKQKVPGVGANGGGDDGPGMGEKVKEVGIGAGMAGGAGYVAYLASIAFMLCLIFALGEVMPTALAALIVTILLGAVAAFLAMKAKKKIQQAGPPIPEQTVESIKQTIDTVKEGATWGLGQTR